MSFILMAKALKVDFPDAHTKLLMLALADHANEETGECFPSLTRLAKRACMSKSTVAVKLNWLEENKWITRDRGTFNKSTRYYLNLDKETVVREEDEVVRQLDKVVLETDKVVRQTDTNLPITYKETINSNITCDSKVKNINKKINYNEKYDEIWKHYPKKVGKAEGYKKYLVAVKKHGEEKIFRLSQIWINDFLRRKDDIKYCVHICRFYSNERYLDAEHIQTNAGKTALTKTQIAG
tara:strand:+ start:336 stop:1049 length:714 start_codon:yes stop_codon:yes gene_type:complete